MGSWNVSRGVLETFSLSKKNLLRTEENLLKKKMLSHPLWLTPSNSLRDLTPMEKGTEHHLDYF